MPVHEIPADDHAIVLMTVPASVEACFAVAVDLEAYPAWAESISAVTVEDKDEHGRPTRARFDASSVGRRSSYVLAYDLSGAPSRLAWSLVESDLVSRLEGSYTFEPTVDGDDGTDVTYELLVEVAVPLPGYVRRRIEDKILEAALRRFGGRVLAVSGADPEVVPGTPVLHRW